MIWFLHGNLGTPADGKHVMRALESAGYKTRSPSLWELLANGPVSLEDAGIRLARHIGEEDPSPLLCAYSLGGRLALHALRHLPSCKGAFLMGAHFGLSEEREKEKRRETDANWAHELRNNEWPEFYRKWTAQPVFHGGKNTLRPAPVRLTKERMANAFECWSLGKQANQLPLLQEYLSSSPVPLILLTGEYDLKFTQQYRETSANLPGGKHDIIPSSGHRLLEDAPQALTSTLLSIIPSLLS